MSDAKADTIIAAVDSLTCEAAQYRKVYQVDTATARFTHAGQQKESLVV